jgi:hypothetical protein
MPLTEPCNLFPLPLTAFERFMLADESTDFPMLFYLQVRLKGVIDREITRLAVDDALSRHPLLCCRVEKSWRGASWVWAGDRVGDTDWDRDRWMKQKPWRQPIDLTTDIGLRVWGEQHADHGIITIQFHHACCDGIGAAQFLEDVAIAYARHYASSTGQKTDLPELRPINLELLKHRNSRIGRRVVNISGSIVRRIRIVAKYTVRYLRQKKLPLLAKVTVPEDARQCGLGLHSLRLTRAETRGLRDAAKQHNASLNDLLVRELMVTAQAWNSKIADERPKFLTWKQPTFCVLVPTSLRGPSDGELPACNVVSYIFMARPVTLVAHPEELLISLRDEMQLVHKSQAGWMFIQAIEAIERIPGLLRVIMKRSSKSCMSTTVLSHMGNMLNAIGSRLPRQDGCIQMGNVLVEDICGIPPIRQGTAATFSTIMASGCLSITLRCCPERYSQADAQELLHTFLECLQRTATPTSPPPESAAQGSGAGPG